MREESLADRMADGEACRVLDLVAVAALLSDTRERNGAPLSCSFAVKLGDCDEMEVRGDLLPPPCHRLRQPDPGKGRRLSPLKPGSQTLH